VPKIPKNALSAGTPSRTPLGELTALPIPPSWIFGKGGKRRDGKGEERMEPDQVLGKILCRRVR